MNNFIWPGVVLIVAIIFLIIFRKPISDKIKGVKTLSKDGVVFGSPDDSTIQQVSAQDVSDLYGSYDTQLIKEIEASIKSDLTKQKFNSEESKVDYLIRHLALTQLYQHFEQNYASMFGTQIKLLKMLNSQAASRVDESYIEAYFNQVKDHYKPSFDSWTVDAYTKYLFDSSLIIQENKSVGITVRGKAYLVWITKAGKDEDKPW